MGRQHPRSWMDNGTPSLGETPNECGEFSWRFGRAGCGGWPREDTKQAGTWALGGPAGVLKPSPLAHSIFQEPGGDPQWLPTHTLSPGLPVEAVAGVMEQPCHSSPWQPPCVENCPPRPQEYTQEGP